MLVKELVKELKGVKLYKCENIEITGLSHDHREAKEGDLFFCLKGREVDGSKFAQQAIEKGVACLVVEQRRGDKIEIQMNKRPKSIKVETQPYPGFPTDLQSQILTLQTISQGTGVIVENLFETRFKIYTELIKMGADITIRDRMAIVNGVKKLYGASVVAPELRGGMSLVLAGLVAEGYTTVSDIEIIDRGYCDIEKDLASLGADIKRLEIQEE